MLPRTRAALAAVAAIVVAGASVNAVVAAPAARTVVTALPALDVQIAARINTARAQRGLTRLRLSRPLSAAANSHSYDMARHGFFAHESSDGTSPWTRLARFYRSGGYRHWQIGETLLWYSGGVDAATAVHDWLTSPEHRAILLAGGFREIGISAVQATSASGADTTLVTADFGVRTH